MIAKKIKIKKSRIHGLGVFSAEKIKKNEFIGTYEGKKTRRDGRYVLWLQDEGDGEYGILGKNDLRYLNHSKKPNAVFYGPELYATRTIQPDDEITFHYGDAWEDSDA